MDYQYVPAILTAVTALVVTFGGGVKWMFSRMDRLDREEREWQARERAKLEAQFNERIAGLEALVNAQSGEIGRLREDLSRYVRHVGVLEGIMKANQIEPPLLEPRV